MAWAPLSYGKTLVSASMLQPLCQVLPRKILQRVSISWGGLGQRKERKQGVEMSAKRSEGSKEREKRGKGGGGGRGGRMGENVKKVR